LRLYSEEAAKLYLPGYKKEGITGNYVMPFSNRSY
jgi:hypothetical protein